MPAYALGTKRPRIHHSAVIAPSATIIGDVTIGAKTSVWPGAVLRGDYGRIKVGKNCSLQDNVVVHCDVGNPGIIGNGVTVAHGATIHACRIADECLIGVGSIVFDGAKIGTHSIIGVGAVVPGGKTIPARSVAVGVPAKVARRATDSEVKMIRDSYRAYVQMSQRYKRFGTFLKAL